MIHVGLDELDEAMNQLKKAYEKRGPELVYLQWTLWDPIRRHSRFQELRRRVGLPNLVEAGLDRDDAGSGEATVGTIGA